MHPKANSKITCNNKNNKQKINTNNQINLVIEILIEYSVKTHKKNQNNNQWANLKSKI